MSLNTVTPAEWDKASHNSPENYVDPYDIQSDPVNKPKHYNTGAIECIDYLKDSLGDGFNAYLEGSIKKYLHRFQYKNKPVEDLRKARWYLDRLITEQLTKYPE